MLKPWIFNSNQGKKNLPSEKRDENENICSWHSEAWETICLQQYTHIDQKKKEKKITAWLDLRKSVCMEKASIPMG